MHVTLDWHDNQFNIRLHTNKDAEAFMVVRGCRIVDGKNGPFVSFPATKNENSGKWWNHVMASDEFQAHVLKLAEAAKPKSQKASKQDDYDPDVPF